MNAPSTIQLCTIFNNPTFLGAYGSPVGTTDKPQSTRKALFVRESGHNALAAGATRLDVNALVSIDGKNYIMCAHNGSGFLNIANQKDCITPNRSGSGRFGQGGSNSGFLGVDNPHKMETIWYAKNADGKTSTVRLTMDYDERAIIDDLSDDWNQKVEDNFTINHTGGTATILDGVNVAYLVRWEEPLKGQEDEKGFGIINGDDFGAIIQLCPSFENKIEILIHNNSSGHKRSLCWLTDYNKEFCLAEKTWKVSGVEIEEDLIVDCEVTVRFYPYLQNKTTRRPIRVRGDKSGNSLAYQRKWPYSMVSYLDHSRFKDFDREKNHRATDEPVSVFEDAKREIYNLGLLPPPKSGKPYKLEILDKVKISECFANESCDSLAAEVHKLPKETNIRPCFDLEVRIIPKENTSQTHRHTVGQLSPFFVLESKDVHRKNIIAPCLKEIVDKYDREIGEFRERFRCFYPEVDSDLLDIDIDAASNTMPKLNLVLKDDNQMKKGMRANTGNIVTNIRPHESLFFFEAYIEKNGQRIEGIEKWSGNVTASEVSGLYTVMIPKKDAIKGKASRITVVYKGKDYRLCNLKMDEVKKERLSVIVKSTSAKNQIERKDDALIKVVPYGKEVTIEAEIRDKGGNLCKGVTVKDGACLTLVEGKGVYTMTVAPLNKVGRRRKTVPVTWNGSDSALDFEVFVEEEPRPARHSSNKGIYDPLIDDREVIGRYDSREHHLFLNPGNKIVRDLATGRTRDKADESQEWTVIWKEMREIACQAYKTYSAYDEGASPLEGRSPDKFDSSSGFYDIWLTTILFHWLGSSSKVERYRKMKERG